MNKQVIELARKRFNLPDTLTDDEIAEGLSGSLFEARAEFYLAWQELKAVFKGCLRPFDT